VWLDQRGGCGWCAARFASAFALPWSFVGAVPAEVEGEVVSGRRRRA
jgi:hypothetical protein